MAVQYTDAQIRNLFPTYFDAAATTTRIDEDIIRKILKMYSDKEGGATYIAKKLKFNPSVITRLLQTAWDKKITPRVPPSEFKTKEAQRIYEPGADRKIYKVVRPITANDRIVNPDIPVNARFKVQVPSGQKKPTSTKMVYTTTESGAENALKKADKLIEARKLAVDSEASKLKRQRTRTENVKAITKLSSEADKAAIKQIQGGIAEINKYFKNKPELINTSNFGKNVKAMMALRLDKDTAEFYTRAKSNAYYLKKAKQGQLFDLFDINPVAGKKPGGRFPTNVNIAPGQFNRAFVGAQLTNFFKKGVNTETAGELDTILKKRNIRVDLPNIGKVGASGADVAFDTKTGSFPRIVKTLKALKAPNKILEIFNGKRLTNPEKFRVAEVLKCPLPGKAEGGRIGYALGTATINCVNTKLTNEPVQSSMRLRVSEGIGKMKPAATNFLKLLGRGGARAAPLAALAAVGAGIEPLVKQFVADDPETYLTDESQMKGMLLATIEGETPKVDEEILKWQMPALGAATAAGAIPGARETYLDRLTGRGPAGPAGTKLPAVRVAEPVGKVRAALGLRGVLGKALGASFSPLAAAATLPISVAAQRKGGTEWGDIATDPMNWMAPAFASSGYQMASKGIKNPMLLKALRLGISPKVLSVVSRRFGLPGLMVSGGLWGYDKWKNRGVNDPED